MDRDVEETPIIKTSALIVMSAMIGSGASTLVDLALKLSIPYNYITIAIIIPIYLLIVTILFLIFLKCMPRVIKCLRHSIHL